jgi:pimeloyl-ACP methyl ester carboxylesterase
MEDLHVEEVGPPDGPVVVLVHGTLDRSAGFIKVARRLAGDHRVVRYDRRGYGRSRSLPGPYDAVTHVADLVRVLDGRQAVVVGHSYGGDVTLAAAVARPDLVAAVGVFEPPMPWTPWWPTETAGGAAMAAGSDGPAAAEGFMRRMIGDRRWDALPERTKAERRAEGVALLGEMADMYARAPFDLDDVLQPVVVGRGTEGSPHHGASTRRLVELLPDAELFEIVGAGHGAHMSHPDDFAAFVRRVVGRRP